MKVIQMMRIQMRIELFNLIYYAEHLWKTSEIEFQKEYFRNRKNIISAQKMKILKIVEVLTQNWHFHFLLGHFDGPQLLFFWWQNISGKPQKWSFQREYFRSIEFLIAKISFQLKKINFWKNIKNIKNTSKSEFSFFAWPLWWSTTFCWWQNISGKRQKWSFQIE